MSDPIQQSKQPEKIRLLLNVKRVARISLGFIWVYQGCVPKLFTIVPFEREIVERTGIYFISPLTTMSVVGIVEVLFGIWLISGFRERLACIITTLFLLVLTLMVIIEEPSLLIGPFGSIIKNICLLACAWIVWRISLFMDN